VNAAVNIAFSATFVIGPVVGGAIAAGAGASAALLVDTASFLACGALLIDMHPHVEEAGGESVRARLLAAWKHINAVPALRTLLLAQAVALVFFESTPPIEVAYAKTTLHVGDRGFGLLVTVWGIGVAVGSVLFARSAKRSLKAMVSSGTLAVGVAYLGFAVAPSLLVACAAALVGGVGNGVQWAPLISAVQRLTPASLHGRVMGALESIGALAPALGLSLGGALVALSSPRLAFLVVGLGAALTTIGFLRLPLGAGRPAAVPMTDAVEAAASAERAATPRTAAATDPRR
jgi:MFS family permease